MFMVHHSLIKIKNISPKNKAQCKLCFLVLYVIFVIISLFKEEEEICFIIC